MWDQAERALDQSMTRMVSQLASLLPGLVAFFVAVLISLVVAWILAGIVRRSLIGIRFDERVGASVKDWAPSHSASALAARVVAWIVIITGVLIGLTAFDAAWTTALLTSLAAYLPNVIGAVLVLLVGNLTARFLARSVLIGAVNLNLQYARLLSVGVKWLVVVLSVAMALDHLRIGTDIVRLAFGILFGGIVLALALAVGLGSKELVSRSLERDVPAPPSPPPAPIEEPFHHL